MARPAAGQPMTATMERRRVTPRPPAATGPARRGVRMPELVLGVLRVFVKAMAAVVWHRSSTARVDVAVFARDVQRGHVVAAGDLRPAALGGVDGVRLVPWDHRSELLGHVVTADLLAGSP